MVTVCPSQFATRRTLFHVLVGCGLLMLKVSRLKLPVIWLLVSMWLNTLTKSQIWTLLIAYYVHPVNIQTACLIMEGAEFTENIINCVERPVKAAELFAFTLRVRAGNTDVLTDAEENVRQKLRAEGVM